MATKVIHFCSVCGKTVDSETIAGRCQKSHLKALNEKMPKYKIGQKAKVRRQLGEGHSKVEVVKIIKIKGKNFSTSLLVENDNEERYWASAVNYQTAHLQIDPGHFYEIIQII